MIPLCVSDIVRRSGTYVELSARIQGLPSVKEGDRLWFRFPPALLDRVCDSGEPFLAALLPVAMGLGRPLCVEGSVSERFLSGCRQIVSLYSSWDHRLRKVELQASVLPSPPGSQGATGCFFTAGVDSFYSVLKNLEWNSGANRISHLVFVRGLSNCPVTNDRLFDRLYENLKAVADKLNLHLLVVSTNLREFMPSPATGWDWFAGSTLAAPGLCLASMFRRLIIPSGDTYATLSPWGSHPLVDPLWSTEGLEFIHDGCEASRSQKLERYVANSKLALDHLRVCDYESGNLHNCGTCEKCLRTLIGLRALHIAPPRGLFAEELDIRRVGELDGGTRVTGYYLRDNLDLIRRHGGNTELENGVLHALRPTPLRWLSRQIRNALQEFDRRLLKGRVRSWAVSAAARDRQDSALRVSPSRWLLSHWLGASPMRRSAVPRGERRQGSCAR